MTDDLPPRSIVPALRDALPTIDLLFHDRRRSSTVLMRPSFITSALLVLTLSYVAACGSATDGSTLRPAASIAKIGGDEQLGTVGAMLPDPVIVRVVDAESRPLPNQPVRFEVTSGGGSVAVGLATTDAVGRAQERWTLGTSTAADQTLIATVVSSAVGAPVLSLNFSAIPIAGSVAKLVVLGDTLRAIATTDTTRLSIQGTDQYDNVVPPAALTAIFSASPSGIVSLETAQGSQTVVRAIAAGEAVITAAVGAVSARLRLFAEPTTQTVYSVTNGVGIVLKGGARLLATADRTVYEWNGTEFKSALTSDVSTFWLDMAATGEAWINGVDGWYSAAAGSWTKLPAAAQAGYSWIAVADPTYVYSSLVALEDRPYVYRYMNSAWIDLQFPQTIADSAFQGVRVVATDTTTLLAFGALEKRRYGGQFQATALKWTNGTWTELQVPERPSTWLSNSFDHMTAGGPTDPVFAIIKSESGPQPKLVTISGGIVSFSELPPLSTGESVRQIGRTAASEPIVVTTKGWWQRSTSTWMRHLLLNRWTASEGEGFVIESNGTIWLPVLKPQPTNPSGWEYGIARIVPQS